MICTQKDNKWSSWYRGQAFWSQTHFPCHWQHYVIMHNIFFRQLLIHKLLEFFYGVTGSMWKEYRLYSFPILLMWKGRLSRVPITPLPSNRGGAAAEIVRVYVQGPSLCEFSLLSPSLQRAALSFLHLMTLPLAPKGSSSCDRLRHVHRWPYDKPKPDKHENGTQRRQKVLSVQQETKACRDTKYNPDSASNLLFNHD